MKLSVIIVSYNVRYFLEQCLASVRGAIRGPVEGEVEVIVVDNASTDGTLHFIRPLFPGFVFMVNSENSGFARANNRGLLRARGEYVLFLNPDTLVPEDGLQKMLSFMGTHPRAGAAGVRMIDGRGRFLAESKRGFPGPSASFYKMTGLAALFPRSRIFAAYNAGNVAEDSVREVDILSGACMLVRRSVLDLTGGFDERFFMYAEDIDLSWRIRQAGFQNFYLADISIVHFKGESTKRDRNYIRQFYRAMHQFRDKYGKNTGPAEWLLRTGIGLREAVALGGTVFPGGRGKEKHRAEYILLGEPTAPDGIRLALERAGLTEAGQATPGCTIVFCEGPGLSWKNIIGAIDAEDPERICLVHGRDTHSLVGSPSSRRQGRVVFLNG